MVQEDTRIYGAMVKHLTDQGDSHEVDRLKSRIQQGGSKEEIIADFPKLPWNKVQQVVNTQPKTVPTQVVSQEPLPSKRPRVEEDEDSDEDLIGEDETLTDFNGTRRSQRQRTSLLNADQVNLKWFKIAKTRGNEKLSLGCMEVLSQGVQEYMKTITERVFDTMRLRVLVQPPNFDMLKITSTPRDVLKAVEDKEKEERREQLRLEHQGKQRKRNKEEDTGATIQTAFETKKRHVEPLETDLPVAPVREVVTIKDVVTVLESEPQWRKSTFLQRLYTCGAVDRSALS